MAKMIEVKLHGLTCEFAGDGDDLDVSGNLRVLAFDDPNNITSTTTIFDFAAGPIRMRKGESVQIVRDARVLMATPTVDPPGFGSLFIRFGGELVDKDPLPDGDDKLGEQFETLHTNDVINTEPRMWRLFFGKNEQIVRADFSVVFLHPV
jgi:hypothetical protein